MVKIYKNDFWEAHVEQKYPCTQKISLLAGKLTFYNPLKLNLSSVHWLICLQNNFKSMQSLAEAASNSCNFD